MLEVRSRETEQMDNLDLSGKALHDTLDGLSTINKYLGNTNAIFFAVKAEIKDYDVPLQIVDLGCGGGDNLRAIADWCAQNDHPVSLIGIDGNSNILQHAEAKNNTSCQVNYIQADILASDFQLPLCDLLISSHFMYHFSDEEFVEFLKRVKSQVRLKMFFSELQRSSFAYSLFKSGATLLPFSKMVKEDGLKAIRRSFRRKELEYIIEKAEISTYDISWKWAFRYLVEIRVKDF